MLEKLVLLSSFGSQVEVYPFGATITSFKSPLGQEMLFLSSKAVLTGEKPIRGGIPIAFPQFAAQGSLPMHGFARTSLWTLEKSGLGFAELSLSDSEKTRSLWDHSFRLVLRISFNDVELTTSLQVFNLDTLDKEKKEKEEGNIIPFQFEALLHTYLNTGLDSVGSGIDTKGTVRVHGLEGSTYIDKPAGGERKVEIDEEISLVGEVDRIYVQPNTRHVLVSGITLSSLQESIRMNPIGEQEFTLSDLNASTTSKVYKKVNIQINASTTSSSSSSSTTSSDTQEMQKTVHKNEQADIVVWNAGPVKCASIADFGLEDWKSYVCVEPGVVSRKVQLEIGEVFILEQRIKFVE